MERNVFDIDPEEKIIKFIEQDAFFEDEFDKIISDPVSACCALHE